MVNFENHAKGSSDSSDEDDDSGMEFDSDDSQEAVLAKIAGAGKDCEMASTTTAQSKKPMIEELQSFDFPNTQTEQKPSTQMMK